MVGFQKQVDGRLINTRVYKEVAKAKLAYNKTECSWWRLKVIKKWENDHKGPGVVFQP
jgi:hypothetical protein